MSGTSVAQDTVAYCGERLSENIVRTPEGFLICKNAVIARTGAQKYLIGELQDRDGLTKGRDRSDQVDVWRSEDQVFAPATVASFEGKPFTVRHPDDLLTPDTSADHATGHVQNVRRGDEPLEDGNWPLLADVHVTDREAIDAILSRHLRELSCGYAYTLVKNGERFEQHDILGNHVALVDSARAGAAARIMDAAPQKESKPMTVKERILKILGLGMKEFAKDADPVELAKANRSMNEFNKVMDAMSEEGKVQPPESQFDAEEEAKKKEAEKKAAEDKKAADDKAMADRKARDDDFGKRMHDALETVLAKHREDKEAKDVDLSELSKLFSGYMSEEKKEPQHGADDDKAKDEKIEPVEEGERKAADGKCAKCGKDNKECACDAKDKAKDAEIVSPEPVLSEEERPESQFDSAMEVLKSLRPFVARSNDQKIRKAFNIALDRVTAAKKVESNGGGGYSEFLAATGRTARDGDGKEITAPETPAERAKKIDEMYAQEREKRSKGSHSR